MSSKFTLKLVGQFELEVTQFGAPIHSDACPEYDGKRCKLIGSRPGTICEPAIGQMIESYESKIRLLEYQIEDKKETKS